MQENDKMSLLDTINNFNYMNASQVAQYLGKSQKTAYRVLSELQSEKYIKSYNVLYGQQGVYCPTKKAVTKFSLQINPIKSVSLASYEHTLFCTDVGLYFLKKKGEYTTERQLRRLFVKSFEQVAYDCNIYPDGMYVTPSGKKIAIECEIAKKPKNYIISKLDNLNLTKINYDAVFFFFKSKTVMNFYRHVFETGGYGNNIKCYMAADLERSVSDE